MAAVEKPTVDILASAATDSSEQLSVVESPSSPSSSFALSRFEFEAGKGNEGTKVLMVEWDTSAAIFNNNAGPDTDARPGDASSNWEVSWEGKTTALPIGDAEVNAESEDGNGVEAGGNTSPTNRRVYFLLPPGAPIPALVSISQGPAAAGSGSAETAAALRTKPMPAIFPEELAGGREVAGRRGVLHTIWAKKRLAELQAEIVAEMKANGESVGLEMAVQERQWIVDHFGLPLVDGVPGPTRLHIPQQPAQGLPSPRSPVGGRLGEKLRGLRLATSPTDLAAATKAAKATPRDSQPRIGTLSPEASDVAVSSFAMFPDKRPPQEAGNGAVTSLDAVLETGALPTKGPDVDTEEDLFALPMSPRSPEMKKSPFSLL